jgi:hypothetical protein
MWRRFLTGLIMLQGQLAGLARRRTGRQATASPTGMHFSSRAPLSQDSRRIRHISDREYAIRNGEGKCRASMTQWHLVWDRLGSGHPQRPPVFDRLACHLHAGGAFTLPLEGQGG